MEIKSGVLALLLALSISSCESRPLSASVSEADAAPIPKAVAAEDEITVLVRRYNDPKHANLLQSATWTLTHDYKDFKRIQEVLKSFGQFMDALQKHVGGNTAPLEQLGGVKAFKENTSVWLRDNDQAVRAFGAIIIGINGDRERVPELLKILKRKDPDEKFSDIYD